LRQTADSHQPTAIAQTKKNNSQQHKKHNMIIMVPPARRPTAASILMVSPIAVRRAINFDRCNTVMYFLLLCLTISLFYYLFITGTGTAHPLAKCEYFVANSIFFSAPLYRNNAH